MVYASYYDEALVKRITAEKYQTFVVMPFEDQSGYQSEAVLNGIKSAFTKRDEKGGSDRRFGEVKRVDSNGAFAIRITDEIVSMILESNFIIADITGSNENVLLELGIALASRRDAASILVISQGSQEDVIGKLSFDIRDVRVMPYEMKSLESELEKQILKMEKRERELKDELIVSFMRNLPVNSVSCLYAYCDMYKDAAKASAEKPPIVFENSGFCARFPCDSNARVYFDLACEVLVRNHLMVCDYETVIAPNQEKRLGYASHATELGWQVMKIINSQVYDNGYANWRKFARPMLMKRNLIGHHGESE